MAFFMKSLWKNKKIVGGLLALLIAVLLLVLNNLNLFNNWQDQLADAFYKGRQPSKDIVIIAVDEKSISDAGLGRYEVWERSNFAKVLENVSKYSPKVIGFDFYFRAAKNAESDKLFQEALSNSDSVAIIYPGNPASYDAQKGYFFQAKGQAINSKPLSLFLESKNVILSLANFLLDNDGIARRIMPIIFDEETKTYQENLAFAVLRKFLDGKPMPSIPLISSNEYQIETENGTVKIPLEQGQMLNNYALDPSTHYTQLSFVDVYNENYGKQNPENIFKDKIVLIGPSALFFKDGFFTPNSKQAQILGVEIQANAIQTVLDQKFLRNLSLVEKALLYALLFLLAAGVFMFMKIRWSLIFLAGSSIIYTLLGPFFFSRGIILDLIGPYLGLALMFTAVYLYRYFTEFKSKIELKNAFNKYVNPEVVNQIMAHPEDLKLGGEKREITVLFTDIAHFTTLSEKLKPESLVALLNEYFEAMSAVILEEGGTLDKYEGDAIMAFFGAPLHQPDHALRACNAALKMRQKLVVLLQKWEQDPPLPGGEKKPQIDFRCGISSGEVIVGNVGSSDRFDYTVMGDIVNLGSRLEGTNKHYETHTILSEQTFEMIKDQFETREIDFIRVVGKKQPIKIHELLNTKGSLVTQALELLELYKQGITFYQKRLFTEALGSFNEILKKYPNDGPSKVYRQRSEVLKDFPPKADWDGVFEMGTK